MIAHRLSTLQRCDRVIRLENGKIVDDEFGEDFELLALAFLACHLLIKLFLRVFILKRVD